MAARTALATGPTPPVKQSTIKFWETSSTTASRRPIRRPALNRWPKSRLRRSRAIQREGIPTAVSTNPRNAKTNSWLGSRRAKAPPRPQIYAVCPGSIGLGFCRRLSSNTCGFDFPGTPCSPCLARARSSSVGRSSSRPPRIRDSVIRSWAMIVSLAQRERPPRAVGSCPSEWRELPSFLTLQAAMPLPVQCDRVHVYSQGVRKRLTPLRCSAKDTAARQAAQ